MNASPDCRPYRDNHEYLQDELRRLDLLIRLRTMTLPLQNQAFPEEQTARTAYITSQEVTWLLDQHVAPAPGNAGAVATRAELTRLDSEIDRRVERTLQAGIFLALPQLSQLFRLSAFEKAALVICLAPELRRKYDRLYAYLQDDITRKRPSVDLLLDLLWETEAERWQARSFFFETAPLLRTGLLQKVDDPHSPSGSSGLAQFLKLDPHICEFLLGSSQIDARLAGQAQFYRPADEAGDLPMDAALAGSILSLIKHHLAPGQPDRRKLVLYLHGPYGVGKRALALHICRQLGVSLLSIDLEGFLAPGQAAEPLLRLAFREGLLQQTVLYLERGDVLAQDTARPLLKALTVAIAEYGWLVLLSGETPWTRKETFPGCLFQTVALPVPDVPLRAAAWQRRLDGRGPEAAAWATQLAAQFRLTPGQIQAAVELAANQCVMGVEPSGLTLANLAAACRQQSNQKLGELAVRVEPHYGWADLILPEEKVAQLKEICGQVRYRYRVFGEWGFDQKLAYGKGLSVLFSGPPGTGKTLAAQVIAHELQLALYKVDLSGVVSKYIGETEKNLSKIFHEAETSNAILFFDEADALFGKRTEVADAHDRYANIETSYLLQKMEEFEGVVMLATNLRENMDEAFTRRIRFIVEFPFPDEGSRLQIWKTHFPQAAPLSEEIDFEYLSRQFKIAGGNIKNIVLNSAFLAAENGGVIGMDHILHGVRREFEKVGKLWSEKNPYPTRSRVG